MASAFTEKTQQPTESDLRLVLGRAYDAWSRLLALVAERIASVSQVWGFASARDGWSLRVLHKKRIIFYMTPQHGQFVVSFALGEKAAAAAHAAGISASVLRAIDAVPRYTEGRGVRIEVRNSGQVEVLATLAQIKQKN